MPSPHAGRRPRQRPQRLSHGAGTEAGLWPRLHEILLAELRKAGLLDMDDAAIDGSHVRALKGGLTPDLRRSTARGLAASTT
jgi:hypothetical protein